MFTIFFHFFPRVEQWISFPENVNVFRGPSALEALGFFFSGRKDPLSYVSAGTGLPATEKSTGASGSDRYHAQDGRYPG